MTQIVMIYADFSLLYSRYRNE